MKLLNVAAVCLCLLLVCCCSVNAARRRKLVVNGSRVIEQYTVTTPAGDTNVSTNELEQLKFKMFFVFDGIINPIVCIIGMISNILNMIVLTRRRMRTSTNLFLFALAIADFSILLICCLYYIRFCGYYDPPIVPPNSLPETEAFFWWLYFHTWYMIANIFLTSSNWLILSVTVYRFIAVCFPIQAQRMCTSARARIAIVIIYLTALVLNLPDFFTVEYVESVSNNKTYPKMNMTEFYYSTNIKAFQTTKLALNIFIPWIACLILTIILIITLKDSSERLRHISAHSQSSYGRSLSQSNAVSHRADDQKKISRMLILLVVWFLICEFPSALLYILQAVYDRQITENSTPFLILRLVADVFLTANYASNFFLYAASNQLYRKVLVNVLTCRKTRRFLGTRSGSTSNDFRTQISVTHNGSRTSSPSVRSSVTKMSAIKKNGTNYI